MNWLLQVVLNNIQLHPLTELLLASLSTVLH